MSTDPTRGLEEHFEGELSSVCCFGLTSDKMWSSIQTLALLSRPNLFSSTEAKGPDDSVMADRWVTLYLAQTYMEVITITIRMI